MELIENLLQLLTTFLGALLSGIAGAKKPQTGVFFAALLLRLLCLGGRFTGHCTCCCSTPRRGSFRCRSSAGSPACFLRILAGHADRFGECGFAARKAWLAPLVGVPLLGFYCTYGDILSNLIWCGLTIWRLLRYPGTVLCGHPDQAKRGIGGISTSACCAMSVRNIYSGRVGCFWSAASPASPAFWCDLLLTFALLGLLPAVRKAVEL